MEEKSMKSIEDTNAQSSSAQKSYKCPVTGIKFVLIKGGHFSYERVYEFSCRNSYAPIDLNDFYMSIYPVTQGQWERIMSDDFWSRIKGTNPSYFKKGDDYPVEQVNWKDIQRFLKIINSKTDGKYRLPYQVEWQYAASEGGNLSVRYGNGKSEAKFDEINYDYRLEKNKDAVSKGIVVPGEYRGCTTPVGLFKPNALGLYDMSGNVKEMCQDKKDDEFGLDYFEGKTYNCSDRRVARGGSWNSECGSVIKTIYDVQMSGRSNEIGFRLVRTI